MGNLCSRLKVRLSRGHNAPHYDPLRSETPTSMDSEGSNEMTDHSAWDEARVRTAVIHETPMEREEVMSELEFDKMAAQIRQLYQPIDFLTNAVTNSLLLFKVSVGLTKDSSIDECFRKFKTAIGETPGIELIKTVDGPRKVSISPELWRTLSDDLQSAISHFNSMLSSAHKFLGSKELKLTDIQLKLEDIKLLPKTKEKEREYRKLKGIVKKINDFTAEIDLLFDQINTSSEIFEHQIINGSNNNNENH